ncbi:MAG: hypothetical protein RXN78_07500 [Vulcanisaeta sp.]
MVEWIKVLEDFIRSGVKANHRRAVVLVGSSIGCCQIRGRGG